MAPTPPPPKQAGFTPVQKSAAALAAGTAVLGFIAQWEGKRNVDYLDIVGVPTACYGSTRGAVVGKRRTDAECRTMLARDVTDHALELSQCIRVDVPSESYQAFVSWTYNVGATNACRSTLIRKLNAGDLRGACDELPKWNKAGGKVVKGLTNRRLAERELCLKGVTP